MGTQISLIRFSIPTDFHMNIKMKKRRKKGKTIASNSNYLVSKPNALSDHSPDSSKRVIFFFSSETNHGLIGE